MARKQSDRASSNALPQDRFDALPKTNRVGAHRITARMNRFWRYFLVGVLATAVLVTAGIIGLNAVDGATTTTGEVAEQPQSEQVKPELDPTATIAVLNGTPTPNLAAGVDQVISQNGWGVITFSEDAASRDVQISAVFYAVPEDEPAAAALAAELGGVSTYASQDYTAYEVRLVVLLGADYAGPGGDEAAAITAQLGARSSELE